MRRLGPVADGGCARPPARAAYVALAGNGRCYLFHAEHDGHSATVEVRSDGRVVQSQGPENTHNPACDWARERLGAWGQTLLGAAPPGLSRLG